LLFNLSATSKKVSLETAQKVASNFLSERSKSNLQQLIFHEVLLISENGMDVCYVFNSNKGFIIVSADDAVYPVLGYAFEGHYSGENVPPAFQVWMNNYSDQILYGIEIKQTAPLHISKAWLKYTATEFKADWNFKSVEPMLQTTWHQGCYYNSLFPADTSSPCGHLWAGCVATAMGQLMKYYNFPESGIGSHGYNSSYGWVEADFENTVYNWANMKHHLDNENLPVAEILYHAAISINSQFYPNGTGAFDFDARDALVDYFNYKDDAQFYWRDSFQGDWKAMLRNELDQGRPLLYGGADSVTQAGHTLVCDGYQDTAFFHFNWGWNGFYNGYYYIDTLVAGGNVFNYQQDAVVGLSPAIEGPVVTHPPEDLIATVDNHMVTLTWEYPSVISSLELIGYHIYRNDSLLTETALSDVIYIDSDVPAGSFEYKVQSVYIGQGYGPSAVTEAYISNIIESEASLFQVYPNPASDCIVIEMTDQTRNILKCTLVDLNGRVLISEELYSADSGKEKFDVSSFAPGVYIFQVKEGSKIFCKKLVIRN
jgi:hypothetical protein